MLTYVGYISLAQHMYTMMHSEWAEDSPVYGDACSFIKRNGTEGFWFSTNCSEENSVICMDKYRPIHMLPSEAESSTQMYQSTRQSVNHSTAITHTGRHIKLLQTKTISN